MVKEKHLRILLVDDDPVDRELFKDAINSSNKNYTILELSNGYEAGRYLADTELLPDIIFLDLNMPVKDGRETLKELKSHSRYKTIPVCILSTSSAYLDVMSSYENGANFFLVKPFDYHELVRMVSCVLQLFSKYLALPLHNERGQS